METVINKNVRTDRIVLPERDLDVFPMLQDKISSNVISLENQFEITGGVDDRKRIGNTRDVPFRWICMLDLHNKNGDLFGGTGVLVSPRHVLTAGHNLDGCIKVEVTPGISGSFRPFGTYVSTTFKVHEKWKRSRDDSFDIGIIRLPKRIGNRLFRSIGGKKLGYWGSSSYSDEARLLPFIQNQQLNKKANLAGYPFDKGFNQLWWDIGKIVITKPRKVPGQIYYTMDTCGANSGSPVWLKSRSTGIRFLIAIHSGPCIKDGIECEDNPALHCPDTKTGASSNGGVFLSSEMIRTVRQWIRSV
jgi:V8-like Glu-specific endopeptidase